MFCVLNILSVNCIILSGFNVNLVPSAHLHSDEIYAILLYFLATVFSDPALNTLTNVRFQSDVHFPFVMSFQTTWSRSRSSVYFNMLIFMARRCQPLDQFPRSKTTPCWLSTASSSIYCQLHTVSGSSHLHPQREGSPCRCGAV